MADRQRQTSEIDRQVIRDVNTVGWHVIPVPPGERSPGWAFSIGLFHNHQHPEIILFGLPAETLMPRLSQLCTDVAAGESYRPGATSRDVLDGYICEFRPVHERWLVPFLGHAGWFYGGRDFPVVQFLVLYTATVVIIVNLIVDLSYAVIDPRVRYR